MASEHVLTLSAANFEKEVTQHAGPVLVDFWAEWCGPCKMIAPMLDEASKTYDGRVQITKMNVDDNREVPGKYGIRGIPTLMLFKDGQVAATRIGALPQSKLFEWVQSVL